MKIECSRQLWAGQTDRQTDRQSDSLGSLVGAKKDERDMCTHTKSRICYGMVTYKY